MSKDKDSSQWMNLNPDPNDLLTSNLYYNASDQQFSLTPVYNREEFGHVLASMKSKCTFINFDYLQHLDGFYDLIETKDKEPLTDLQQYTSEEIFLDILGQKLHSEPSQHNVSFSNKSISNASKNSKRHDILSNNNKEIAMELEEEKNKADSDDNELTFKDLRNLNVEMAEKYRINLEEKNLDDILLTGNDYEKVLKSFFEKIHNENLTLQSLSHKSIDEVLITVLIQKEVLVEFLGSSLKKAKKQVSKLLLAYFCPQILKKIKENTSKKSRSEEQSVAEESDNSVASIYKAFYKNYKALLPKKQNEEELREKIEMVLNKGTFHFNCFLTEMKNELLQKSKSKSRQDLEKETLKESLKTLHNMFKYYKLVLKQSKSDDIQLFAHKKDDEFTVTITKTSDKKENSLLSLGSNVYKGFAFFFALTSFFESYLAGSFKTVNEVYSEIRKSDRTYIAPQEEKNGGDFGKNGLDMVSMDLLNEIDNYK